MEKLTFLEHLVSLKPVVGEPQYLESKEVKRVENPENWVSKNNEKSGIGWAVEPELIELGKNGGIDDAWGGENKILISEDLERVDISWEDDPNEGMDVKWDGQELTNIPENQINSIATNTNPSFPINKSYHQHVTPKKVSVFIPHKLQLSISNLNDNDRHFMRSVGILEH